MEREMLFIERYSIDRRFYCRVEEIKTLEEWEIRWTPSEANARPWALKKVSAKDWESYSHRQLLNQLSSANLNVVNFQRELHAVIKNILVFSNIMQTEARKIIGEEAVGKALDDYEKFTASIVRTIRDIIPKSRFQRHHKKANLKLLRPSKS